MVEEQFFKEALKNKKIPILVLDQKWHRLFDATGKPNKVVALENNVNRLVGRQGKLNQEIKDLKRLKSTLMGNVMLNMEGTGENVSALLRKKLDEDKRLITEINERIDNFEEELTEIPLELKEYNDKLMLESMKFCYETLKVNSEDIREISEWIRKVRIELKKNILVKQNQEINNRAIYTYLHDLFGAQVVDMFDMKIGDIRLGSSDDRDSDTFMEISKDMR